MLWTPQRAIRQPVLAYTPMTWPGMAAPVRGVVTGSGGVWSSWLSLASGADLPDGADLLELTAHGPYVGSGYAESGIFEVGFDPAGGTSFTEAFTLVAGNVIADSAPTTDVQFKRYSIPLRIPPGVGVGVRFKRESSASGNMRWRPYFWRGVRSGQYAQTLGTPSGARGQAVVPGNNAWGSWVDLGTLARPAWWWQLSWGISDSSIAANYYEWQLAYGDGTTYTQIGRWFHAGNTTEIVIDIMDRNLNPANCYREVPAGVNIYLRGYGYNTSPDSNIHALALAVGGG